jgi:transposase
MSKTSITQYFFPGQVKIMGQSFSPDYCEVVISMRPNLRLTPRCSECGGKTLASHDTTKRLVRDLNLAATVVWLNLFYRKLYCPLCKKVRVERQEFVEPYVRVTKRLARYIHELCKIMTVKEVAEHVGLDWKTVKNIDKVFLEEEFGQTDYTGLRILALDEIAIHKGHRYMTVALDHDSGRIIWMGEGRSEETLDSFFTAMPEEVRKGIVAVASDMWKPYLKAIKKWCPGVKVVFDLFHLVKDFNQVIDKIRNEEYRKANDEGKAVLKGTKYLLLKNREHLQEREAVHLKKVLELNKTLSTVYILKDYLKEIYRHRDKKQAKTVLEGWCNLAWESENPELIRFARKLKRHSQGILNHCIYPIHTGKLEGVNNTLKVIKRKAYGYLDTRYFILKSKQAFPGN